MLNESKHGRASLGRSLGLAVRAPGLHRTVAAACGAVGRSALHSRAGYRERERGQPSVCRAYTLRGKAGSEKGAQD